MTNPLEPRYKLSVLDVAAFIVIAGFTGVFIGAQWASWYLCSCR